MIVILHIIFAAIGSLMITTMIPVTLSLSLLFLKIMRDKGILPPGTEEKIIQIRQKIVNVQFLFFVWLIFFVFLILLFTLFGTEGILLS